MTGAQVWLALLAFMVGWVGGGLVNSAADSLPGVQLRGERSDYGALWRDRSHCWVLWWYWRRRGRCPHCGQMLGWRYPVTELAAIALTLIVAVQWGWALETAIGWLYALFLLAVAVIDFEHHRVLNLMLAPAAVVAAVISLLPPAPDPLSMAIGGVVGFGIFLLLAIIGRGALGMGDVKLAGVIGMMAGYPTVLTALIIGAIAGGVAALVLLVSRKATRKTKIAYAPYLALGVLLTMWIGFGV